MISKPALKEARPATSEPVLFSIILCVHNDWQPLHSCLTSLSRQEHAPRFEVVLVDDGSSETIPQSIRRFELDLLVRFIRQSHAGLAAARNSGIRIAKGQILVFTDCDCVLQPRCLSGLLESVANHPEDSAFQLNLVGDPSHLVGQSEDLRLSTLQSELLTTDGHVRYFNTAGAAIRKIRTARDGAVFDPRAIRAQDSLLFAELVKEGELPRFVAQAFVRHQVQLSLSSYISKGLRTGYVEGQTFEIIRSLGVSVRTDNSGRLRIFRAMWRKSFYQGWGCIPFLVVTLKQCVTRIGGTLYRCSQPFPRKLAFHSGLNNSGKKSVPRQSDDRDSPPTCVEAAGLRVP